MLEIMKFYVGNGFWAWLGLTVAGFVILSVVSETIIQLIKSITTIIRGYPTCKYIKQEEKETKKEITSCPQCDGKIVEKKTKKGKIFYGCNNYPKCNFASWDIPTGERCPNCNSLLVENKKNIKCAKCEYIKEK